jgi:hypothetical protein
LSEYATKVASQVHHKYQLLGQAGYDLGLVSSEFSNTENFLHHFDEASSAPIVVKQEFAAQVLKKVRRIENLG